MSPRPARLGGDGLTFVRLALVVSALSPVFLLWAIRGVTAVDDKIWIPICLGFFLMSNAIVAAIWARALYAKNEKTLTVSNSSEQRDYLITYLLAVTIPIYQNDISSVRGIIAAGLIFLFVVYVFWWVKLGYINIIFAVLGYRVHTVDSTAPGDGGGPARITTYVFISRREHIPPGSVVTGIRLGGDVLLERT